MNPLTAQQISRTEHSQRQASQKEPSSFLKAKVKPFYFISKFFRSQKQTLKKSVEQPSLPQKLGDSQLGGRS